jgi:AGZA family xanthine/uracil permease-like MFS transporter
LLPNIANWCQSQIDGALGAAGTTAQAVGLDKLAGNGVIYRGMELFGGGATLAGLILGAIAAFIIDREFEKAAIYAAIGAVLAFFGFINGTQLAFGNSAPVALGYAVLAVTCLTFGRGSLKFAAGQSTGPAELAPSESAAE